MWQEDEEATPIILLPHTLLIVQLRRVQSLSALLRYHNQAPHLIQLLKQFERVPYTHRELGADRFFLSVPDLRTRFYWIVFLVRLRLLSYAQSVHIYVLN